MWLQRARCDLAWQPGPRTPAWTLWNFATSDPEAQPMLGASRLWPVGGQRAEESGPRKAAGSGHSGNKGWKRGGPGDLFDQEERQRVEERLVGEGM